jgi:hypothetical protein
VAGQAVNIRGTVGRDVIVAGGDIDLSGTAAIGRDLLFAAAERIRVDALIEDSVRGTAASAFLSNGVGGNIEIETGKLTIESTANIEGNLNYTSKSEAVIQPGAQIGGTTTREVPEPKGPVFPRSVVVWLRVAAFFMTLAAGIVIIVIAPKRAVAVASSIKGKPWQSLGWGAIAFFATPIAVIIALVTIVGIPLGLIGLAVYLIAVYLAQIAVGLFIGYWIIGYLGKVESRGMLIGALALGFTILTLVKLIPVVGAILWFATVIFGIGAMALSQRTLSTNAQAALITASQS